MELSQQFFSAYITIYRPLLNRLNTILAPYNLFHSQWTILKLLKLEGEMTSAEIAARQQVEKPSVTKIVQRLVEMELVSARPGEDRREKWLGLTDTGQETVERILDELQAMYKELLGDVDPQEVETAAQVMECIRKNLNN